MKLKTYEGVWKWRGVKYEEEVSEREDGETERREAVSKGLGISTEVAEMVV